MVGQAIKPNVIPTQSVAFCSAAARAAFTPKSCPDREPPEIHGCSNITATILFFCSPPASYCYRYLPTDLHPTRHFIKALLPPEHVQFSCARDQFLPAATIVATQSLPTYSTAKSHCPLPENKQRKHEVQG